MSEFSAKNLYAYEWEDDFPQGFGHTSISYLKRCEGYHAAKNGDIDAAMRVVERCVKTDRIDAVREQFPNTVLLPVISQNMIPLALAMYIGLPVHEGVRRVDTQKRRELPAILRLMYKPKFSGRIIRGVSYIIVDDVITQGGTVASLRHYVLKRGGTVLAVIALAFAIGSRAITPIRANILRILLNFNIVALINTLATYGICSDIRQLTNSQVRYILRFRGIHTLEIKLAKFGQLQKATKNYEIAG